MNMRDIMRLVESKQVLPNLEAMTRDELERVDTDVLDRAAYGHVDGEIIRLTPSDIHIRFNGDLENPQDKFDREGMRWVRSVDFSEPVEISIGRDGLFYLEDGHHRWFAASKLKRKIKAEIVRIDGNPIDVILNRRSSSSLNEAYVWKLNIMGMTEALNHQLRVFEGTSWPTVLKVAQGSSQGFAKGAIVMFDGRPRLTAIVWDGADHTHDDIAEAFEYDQSQSYDGYGDFIVLASEAALSPETVAKLEWTFPVVVFRNIRSPAKAASIFTKWPCKAVGYDSIPDDLQHDVWL